MPRIFDEDEDQEIAEAILTILYLQYVISGNQTVSMTAGELAEATLTSTGAISGEQRMTVILGEMAGKIPQLEYDARQPGKGARFYPHQPGMTSQQILDQFKEEFAKRPMEIIDCWTKTFVCPSDRDQGSKGVVCRLFHG